MKGFLYGDTLYVICLYPLNRHLSSLFGRKKVKVTHTRLPSVWFWSRSRYLAVSLQVTWVINLAVGSHYFPSGPQLPSQPLRGLLPILVNRGTMGVNSLSKTVTRHRCGCDLNPCLTAPESSKLTTRLPSHRVWTGKAQLSSYASRHSKTPDSEPCRYCFWWVTLSLHFTCIACSTGPNTRKIMASSRNRKYITYCNAASHANMNKIGEVWMCDSEDTLTDRFVDRLTLRLITILCSLR